ncbi:MAG: teichuronic acid biosynthesis glycosyltransferase TuaH [Francisellaceae bacterium]|jgi:teichuronic acid biosynthesis glycosyltransferase TuaH
MRILLLSHASLATGFVVGSHQLARQFCIQGHEVYHVSSPVSLLNLFKSSTGLQKLKVALFQKNVIDEHWLVKDHIPFLPFPLGYSDILDRINAIFIKHYIKTLSKQAFDLILVDQPLFHPVLRYFDACKIIYRPTDIYGEMGGPRFDYAETGVFNYTQRIAATNLNVLAPLQNKYHVQDSIVLNNGVDLEFFNNYLQKNNKRDGVIYVGAIDFRFDLTFVINIAYANSEIQFDMFGPVALVLPAVLPQNLKFKGAVEYLSLPSLMQNYRYGLMPFNNHSSNMGRSPMKLWEYHAAGLKIIAKMRANDMLKHFTDAIYIEPLATGENILIDEKPIKTEALANEYLPSWHNIAKQLLTFANKKAD